MDTYVIFAYTEKAVFAVVVVVRELVCCCKQMLLLKWLLLFTDSGVADRANFTVTHDK